VRWGFDKGVDARTKPGHDDLVAAFQGTILPLATGLLAGYFYGGWDTAMGGNKYGTGCRRKIVPV
jgi:hypothetical protein